MRISIICNFSALALLGAACAQQGAMPPSAGTPAAAAPSAMLDIATLAMPNDRNRADIAQDFAGSKRKSDYTLAMAPGGAGVHRTGPTTAGPPRTADGMRCRNASISAASRAAL